MVSSSKRIDIIAGARPNFIKIAPIIRAITNHARDEFTIRLVHTGQHFDRNMSGSFFEELSIPEPDFNLGGGGGTQAEQTGKIMVAYEKLLMDDPCDLCIVVGDVTSTLACSIVAKKQKIKVAHVEGGIRSGDMEMPEEVNRIVTDSITDYFFTTTPLAGQHLVKSGVSEDRIFWVGNTMIDTLTSQRDHFRAPAIWEEAQLKPQGYIVMTLHRPSNVDDERNLKILIEAIIANAEGIPLVFPVHPRTRQILDRLDISHSSLHLISPLPYLEFNYLVEKSKAVITDSGGITEEATVMGVPCMTLRDSTERPETVNIGTNELLGSNPDALQPAMEKLMKGQWKKGGIPEKWDGKTSERIVELLKREMI